MGIFFNNPALLYEFEVDGKKSEDTTKENDYDVDGAGGEEGGEPNDPKPNAEKENNDDNKENEDGTKEDDYDMENDEEDDNEGEDNTEEKSGEEEDDGVKEEDYTIEDEDDDEEGTDDEEGNKEGGENNIEDTGEEGESSDNNTEKMDNKLKDLEGQLFDILSDEQKQIKIDELKKCYQELHNRCDNIINIINNSNPPDENTSRIFEYLNDNMSDLKQYLYDYFTYTFNTKIYMENDAQYKKYLAILNSFNTILEEVLKKKEKEE